MVSLIFIGICTDLEFYFYFYFFEWFEVEEKWVFLDCLTQGLTKCIRANLVGVDIVSCHPLVHYTVRPETIWLNAWRVYF